MAELTDVEITERIIQYLVDNLDGWQYEDHAGADVAVFYRTLGSSPDVAVGVQVYGDASIAQQFFEGRLMQVRYRGAEGDPTGADALAGAAHPVLKSLSRLGGISGVGRISFTSLGADTNDRAERSDNYAITLDNEES